MTAMLTGLAPYFDVVPLAPIGWPVNVCGVMPCAATFARWPGFPSAATTARGRMGHGKGLDLDSSIASGIGEAVEIASCCSWGDEEIVEAAAADIGPRGWGPELVAGFSYAQRAGRGSWNARLAGLDWVPPEPAPNRSIGWMQAWSLSEDRHIWIPADAVLIGRRENGDAEACAVADTNGCAAGETADAAIRSAICELIERDATARWWYGGRIRKVIEPHIAPIAIAAGSSLVQRDRILRLLDITTDIEVPTVAAIAANHAGRSIAAGFATRGSLRSAAAAAVLELMQIELRILAALFDTEAADSLGDWLSEGDLTPLGWRTTGAGSASAVQGDEADLQVSDYIARLSRVGCRLALIDRTRRELGVPVFKAVSPDLCHWKPRFGRPRLLQDDPRDMDRDPACRTEPNPVLLRI